MEEFTLEQDETVLLTVRRHWLVFTLELLPFAVGAFIPFLVAPLLGTLAASLPEGSVLPFTTSLSEPAVRLALGLWWLFLWVAAFTVFTRSYLDQWVITSTRVVNIGQEGFFHRRVESYLLVRIQDVSTEIQGLIPTLVGFGSVRIETAGDASRTFRMYGLPKPEAIRDLIIREIAKLHKVGSLPPL